MKNKPKLIFVIAFISIALSGFSQVGAGIYMFIPNVSGDQNGPGTHNGETNITSYSRSYSTQFNFAPNGGSGGSLGRTTNGGLTILKSYSKSSIPLKDNLWRGNNLQRVEIRFYNNSDVLYYKITLFNVFVSDIIESGEVCTGCSGVSEQVKFNFTKVEERDLLANPPIFRCWNYATNTANCN